MAHYVDEGRKEGNLSPVEIQTLRDCMKSSLWTHSLPAGLGTAAFLTFLERRGLKRSVWITVSAVTFSALAARFAAIPGCVKHTVEQVPDGELATQINENRLKKMGRSNGILTSHESDTTVSDYDVASKPPPPSAPILGNQQTYDDFRRRNREDFVNKRKNQTPRQPPTSPLPDSNEPPQDPMYSSDLLPSGTQYYDPPSPYMDPPISSVVEEEEPKYRKPKRLNKYGDEIEN